MSPGVNEPRRVRFLDLGLLCGVALAAALVWSLLGGVLGGGGTSLSALETTTTAEPQPARRAITTSTTSSTSTTSTTTTTPPRPAWPLTALTATDVDPIHNHAVAVKFDAHPSVRSYDGVERADLVFEELVEGGLTRFVGVFHSSVPERAGPVRSIRTSDFNLLANLGRPLVGFSGGNDLTLQALYATDLVPAPPVGWAARYYSRSSKRRAPHDLEVQLAGLSEASTIEEPAQSPFARGPLTAAGVPVDAVDIPFSNMTSLTMRWDPERGEWIRHDRRGLLTDPAGLPLGWTNVLILRTVYGRSPYDHRSPEVQSVGQGTGLLLHGGTATPFNWSRPAPTSPYELTGIDGAEVNIPPGRTLVELEPSR
ncbi:MAG: DUF3048 domain-containing protein [Actinomycetia bacterium]|nr:DUF3048 domain-containing protein [Actinomycetes bacterium]